jgi:hypothetical protein
LTKKQLQENKENMYSYANMRTALTSAINKEYDQQTKMYLQEVFKVLDLSCELCINGNGSNITNEIYSILS